MLNTFAMVAGLVLAHAMPFKNGSRGRCVLDFDIQVGQRLEREVLRLLPPKPGPLAAERRRLTRLLVQDIFTKVEALESERREEFFAVLKDAGHQTKVTCAGHTLELGPEQIRVTFDETRGLVLHLGQKCGGSLLSILRLYHELVHLIRAVSGAATIEERYAHHLRLMTRWYGVYREEIAVVLEEYGFLRGAINPTRILAIEKNLASVPMSKKNMKNIEETIDDHSGDRQFLIWAELALKTKRRAYVRATVREEDYGSDLRYYMLERHRRRVVDRLGRIYPQALIPYLDQSVGAFYGLLDRFGLITKLSSRRW